MITSYTAKILELASAEKDLDNGSRFASDN